MRTLKEILMIGAFASVMAYAGQTMAATPLFEENFDSSAPTFNWGGNGNITVGSPPASVDLIGGGWYDYQPGHGYYLDMDGTTGSGNDPAGLIQSAMTFDPGTYTVKFLGAGSQVGSVNRLLNVALGDFSQSISLAALDPFTDFSFSFNTAIGGKLMISALGPSDQMGPLVDDIKVYKGIVGSAVPEPTTWALMIMGFGLVGATLRRRQSVFA